MKKIGIFGFIDQNKGGLCSGHFLAIKSYCEKANHKFIFISSPGWIEPGDLSGLPNLSVVKIDPNYSKLFGFLIKKANEWSGCGNFKWFFSFVMLMILWRVRASEIYKILRENRCDAVLIAGFQCPWLFSGVKVVSWTQGPIFGEGDWLIRHPRLSIGHYGVLKFAFYVFAYLLKAIKNWWDIGKSNVIICGSKWAYSQWKKWGCPEGKIKVLPYAYAEKSPRIWKNGGRNDKSFLHLGRIVPRKRIELLIEAFSDPRLADFSLNIVGQFVFPRGEYIKKKFPPNVTYKPQVSFSEVDGLFKENKFLIQVSENENLGSSVMEAMATGIPVLLHRSNGTADYVPNDDWHFFDRYEKDELVASIIRITSITEKLECDWAAIKKSKELIIPRVVGAKLVDIIDG